MKSKQKRKAPHAPLPVLLSHIFIKNYTISLRQGESICYYYH